MDSVEINVNKSIDYSDIGIKNEPVQFENYNQEGWEFYLSNKKMFSSKELDLIEPTMKCKKLPDMFYGFNRFLIVNRSLDILIDFNAIDMLNFASFMERGEHLEKTAINFASKENKDCLQKIELTKEPCTNLKTIYYIPSELKVQFADKWKLVKVERDDIEKRDPVMDWTFSTPYMGTITNLSDSVIWTNTNKKGDNKPKFTIVPTIEEIPVNRLGPDNPIQHYSDVRFFDDELCDNGHCTGNIRYNIIIIFLLIINNII